MVVRVREDADPHALSTSPIKPRGDMPAYRPRNRDTPELKARLQAHKSEILDLLSGTTDIERPDPEVGLHYEDYDDRSLRTPK